MSWLNASCDVNQGCHHGTDMVQPNREVWADGPDQVKMCSMSHGNNNSYNNICSCNSSSSNNRSNSSSGRSSSNSSSRNVM